MPQLCVGNQAHPHDWDVASCSRKYKYDINSLLFTTIDHTLSESDRAHYRNLQSSIATLYAGILTYDVTHGYSLLRWGNIVNIMILKE